MKHKIQRSGILVQIVRAGYLSTIPNSLLAYKVPNELHFGSFVRAKHPLQHSLLINIRNAFMYSFNLPQALTMSNPSSQLSRAARISVT